MVYVMLYYLFVDQVDAQSRRLQKLFQDPMTEVYLMAVHSYTAMLNACNLKLQSKEPMIHHMHQYCGELIRSSLNRFCEPTEISDITDHQLASLDLSQLHRLQGTLFNIIY